MLALRRRASERGAGGFAAYCRYLLLRCGWAFILCLLSGGNLLYKRTFA